MNSDRLGPNAGWTPGSTGEGTRSSALWGKRTGGLARLVVLALAVALCAPMSALAKKPMPALPSVPGFVAPTLLADVTAHPDAQFKVIVSGSSDQACGRVVSSVQNAITFFKGHGKLRRQYSVINGVSAQLSGNIILMLAKVPCISVIELKSTSIASGRSTARAVMRSSVRGCDITPPSLVTAIDSPMKRTGTVLVTDSSIDTA